MRKIYLLKNKSEVHGEDIANMLLNGWVEELLRFLALKTLAGDTTLPFRLAPSGPIEMAWEDLLIMPATYAEVCHALGNSRPIDHDPFVVDSDDEAEDSRNLKRFNSTLRLYQQVFDQKPPELFWAPHVPKRTTTASFMERASNYFVESTICSCGTGLDNSEKATILTEAMIQ